MIGPADFEAKPFVKYTAFHVPDSPVRTQISTAKVFGKYLKEQCEKKSMFPDKLYYVYVGSTNLMSFGSLSMELYTKGDLMLKFNLTENEIDGIFCHDEELRDAIWFGNETSEAINIRFYGPKNANFENRSYRNNIGVQSRCRRVIKSSFGDYEGTDLTLELYPWTALEVYLQHRTSFKIFVNK